MFSARNKMNLHFCHLMCTLNSTMKLKFVRLVVVINMLLFCAVKTRMMMNYHNLISHLKLQLYKLNLNHRLKRKKILFLKTSKSQKSHKRSSQNINHAKIIHKLKPKFPLKMLQSLFKKTLLETTMSHSLLFTTTAMVT